MSTQRRSQIVLALLLSVSTVFSYQAIHDGPDVEKLPPGQNILWTDPGDVSSLDFRFGVGGAEGQPQPPFRFVSEDLSGTAAKINVIDAKDLAWNVKFGPEARASAFCSRLLWACGYFAEREYYLDRGRIDGVHDLKRAKPRVSSDGSFEHARFQFRPESPKYLDGHSWAWTQNPFVGTRELQGLKILALLVSNWDTKDSRDFARLNGSRVMDSNLAIFEDNRSGAPRYLYADVDWGASLGMWGDKLTWSKWDCKGFAQDTPIFLKGVEDDGMLKWGFRGKHRKDITDVTVKDVQWLLQYLGKITDEQLRSGLEASGATTSETNCYAKALRNRIEQLQRAAADSSRETSSQP